MKVARLIAGSATTWGLRPGGTPEYRCVIKPKDIVLNTSTGDLSPTYILVLVVPPGHTGIATALNAEMSKLQW